MTKTEFLKLRKKLGYTQEQLANVLQFKSKTRISELENGHREIHADKSWMMKAIIAFKSIADGGNGKKIAENFLKEIEK